MQRSGQSLDCPELQVYLRLKKQARCDINSCNRGEGIYQSYFGGLTLSQFIRARTAYCSQNHAVSCVECDVLTQIAKDVIAAGVVDVAETFRKYYPNLMYKSYNAKRRFMQLPVVLFEIRAEGKGSQKLIMIEQQIGVDYITFVSLFHKLLPSTKVSVGLNKETLKGLCQLASSESDRKLIKYAACASRNVSAKKASGIYGISSYSRLKCEVETSLQRACEIRNEVLEIAAVEERAYLRTLGVDISSSSESELDLEGSSSCEWTSHSEDFDTDDGDTNKGHSSVNIDIDASTFYNHTKEMTTENVPHLDPDTGPNKEVVPSQAFTPPSQDHLLLMLRENELNWFTFVHKLTLLMKQCSTDIIEQVLLEFANNIAFMDFSQEEERKIEQSMQAYLIQSQLQASVSQDGVVVTDSESDDPEQWLSVKQLKSPEGLEMIKKQRQILRCRTKRRIAKELARNCLLKRKLPKRVSAILKEFPSIGTDIETYVKSKRCGADAWRRTGVITFDGNRRRGPTASSGEAQHQQNKLWNCSAAMYCQE